MATLEIKDLHVSVDTDGTAKEILSGVNLTIKAGETHAIMGPNGSGKSTLSYAIAGHPKYQVTSGEVLLDGEDVLSMTVDERARAGLFLAMQYPVEVPGVSMSNFLRTAVTAVRGEAPKLRHWVKEVKQAMSDLDIDPAFADRSVNEGFSGGEKKRHEILQLALLKPKIAILDETDSGLDVDALRVVSEGINRVTARRRGRRPADHPLHPDPAPHHAGLRARVRRRQDRRVRRLRARRRSSRSTATCGSPASRSRPASAENRGFPDDHHRRRDQRAPGQAVRRRDDPQGLPDPVSPRARRQAAGVPGQRGDLAEAAAGARRAASSTTSSTTPTCTAASTRSPRRRPRSTRARATRSPSSSARRAATRWSSPRTRPRRMNLVARVLGDAGPRLPGRVPATRSSSPRWSTTPTSCRGTSSRSGPARPCGGSASPTTAGSICPLWTP